MSVIRNRTFFCYSTFFTSRYESYLSTHSTRALLSQEEFNTLGEQIQSKQHANEVRTCICYLFIYLFIWWYITIVCKFVMYFILGLARGISCKSLLSFKLPSLVGSLLCLRFCCLFLMFVYFQMDKHLLIA